jgi:hypothetical protein
MKLLVRISLVAAIALKSDVALGGEIHEGFYFGGSGYLVQPFGKSLRMGERLTLGSGYSLYLSCEFKRFLIGIELLKGTFGHDDSYSSPDFIAARVGYILSEADIAPYIAAGGGMMTFGQFGDDARVGPGLSVEGGILFFRSLRWFRSSLVFQFNFPTYVPTYSYGHPAWLPWSTLGIRIQF